MSLNGPLHFEIRSYPQIIHFGVIEKVEIVTKKFVNNFLEDVCIELNLVIFIH